MSEDTDSKRRRHSRVDADIPVRISTIEPERDPLTGRSYFRASQERCANVSRGGAFVKTTELLEPGRRVLVEISLPNGGQVEAIGRIAWTKRSLTTPAPEVDCGIGIEFLGGASEQFTVLEAFVNSDEYEPPDH